MQASLALREDGWLKGAMDSRLGMLGRLFRVESGRSRCEARQAAEGGEQPVEV